MNMNEQLVKNDSLERKAQLCHSTPEGYSVQWPPIVL